MIKRILEKKIKEMAGKYPVVTLTGPRQSGKSTLVKDAFKKYKYVSLEDIDMRDFARRDPRGFLSEFSDKTILDEVQRVPDIISYIQTHTDTKNKEGMYILTGSQNFILSEKISQSLAGRTSILKLLPFSSKEMSDGGIVFKNIDDEIFTGSYPRIFDKKIAPRDYYRDYIESYVEKDVRTLINVGDIDKFRRFIGLCAGRIGQLLNMSSLANETGVTVPTVQSWISILEASYIIYLLRPDFGNHSKRLVKTPKLYFFDTGIACSLLEINSPTQIKNHYLRGSLFENMVINNFIKSDYNKGLRPALSFWRDSTGNEVDLIVNRSGKKLAVEIKSGATISAEFFKGLDYWGKLYKAPVSQRMLVYGGDTSLNTSNGKIVAWKDLF
ncbi:MAG: ATP-binding protein [Bacteroidales bacterium]|nr:ATP-binding protein [Bacteroidales bacterium]MCI1733293.1 ATP-binding protein [Bacteroidales bacterium]